MASVLVLWCKEHQWQSERSVRPVCEPDQVYEVTASCGCTGSFQAGIGDETRCSEHDRVQISVRSDLCSSCGYHQEVILSCGCTGQLFAVGSLNLFISLSEWSDRVKEDPGS